MGLWTGLAIYLVVWWLSLFLVLPVGARTVIDAGDVVRGHASSAPKRPRLLLKMALTTLVAGVFFAIIYVVAESGVISFREP